MGAVVEREVDHRVVKTERSLAEIGAEFFAFGFDCVEGGEVHYSAELSIIKLGDVVSIAEVGVDVFGYVAGGVGAGLVAVDAGD